MRNDIRNVGILAHVDAGKTTITEHMLFQSGRVRSLGSVDKGTAHTDYMDVERERGISVRSAATSFTWKGVNINIIDTPGHVDFIAEVERSLRVLDCAILVVSSVEGVQGQTEVLWKALSAMNIPTIFFINKVDRIGADVDRTLEGIRKKLTPHIVPVQKVLGTATSEPQVVDAISSDENHLNKVIESLCDIDKELLERFVDGEEINADTVWKKLIYHAKRGDAFPALFGSAIKGIGITSLMDGIIKFLPCPSGSLDSPLSGVIYKIDHDRIMGRTTHVRLFNGSMGVRDSVLNAAIQKEEKITQIKKINIDRYEEISCISAGEIGAVSGLGSGRIGDVLGCEDGMRKLYHMSMPFLRVQVFPDKEDKYTELAQALQEMSDEDPALEFMYYKEKKELSLKVMGTIHMEILTSMLKDRFNLNVTFGKASVIYKETPLKKGEGFVSYTMPKPCWAVLRFLIEPGERGSGVSYSSVAKADDILPRYQKQTEKAIPKALEQGLYGWEVTDIKITLIAGEYHVVHTHAPDFTVATPMGIMDGLQNTGTCLLEPILRFQITAPEDAGSRILNDIVQMRGTFDTPIISNGTFYIEGIYPAAASLDYHITLASMTGGRGTISTSFYGYSECLVELGAVSPRRGVNPLDRAKYILYARNALAGE